MKKEHYEKLIEALNSCSDSKLYSVVVFLESFYTEKQIENAAIEYLTKK